MKNVSPKCLLSLVLVAGLHSSTLAGTFRFPIGLTYAQGAYDVMDQVEESLVNEGFIVDDTFVFPVGLTLNPYYEWDSGIGVGLSVGPTIFMASERRTWGGGWNNSDVDLSYIIPVGGFVRYTFLRDGNISPYVRAGVKYPIAGGDYMENGQAGFSGGVGVDFFRTKKVQMVLEVGYDMSKVDVGSVAGGRDDVTFSGLTVTLGVQF